jgi:hypothetical protein
VIEFEERALDLAGAVARQAIDDYRKGWRPSPQETSGRDPAPFLEAAGLLQRLDQCGPSVKPRAFKRRGS